MRQERHYMQEGYRGLGVPEHGLDRAFRTCGAPRGSKPRSPAHDILEQTVALAFDIPACELGSRTRGKARIAFARQVAMYLAHVAFGMTLTDVGALFARDRTTVAYACGVVEDRRDDPGFDRSMDRLEAALYKFAAASIMSLPAAGNGKRL